MPYFDLLKKKECLSLTWKAWLLMLLSLTFIFVFIIGCIHQYLAVTNSTKGNVLIVEGWLPDVALDKAFVLLKSGRYNLILTTGGPLARGSHLSKYSTYADLSAATLKTMGVKDHQVVAVPAGFVSRDRTSASALALKNWLYEHDMLLHSVDVFTLGVHARRSQLLFQQTLGSKINVGVISSPHPDYDSDAWWRTSAGVKTVFSEAIALMYTLIF